MKQFLAIFLLVALTHASDLDEYLMDDMDSGDRHPYVQCKIDLYDCVKAGALTKKECLKTYYTCMKQLIPTVPPFVIQCKTQLESCRKSANGFLEQGRCYLDFAVCLKNRGPSSPVMALENDGGDPPRHPYVQCKIDLYDCIRLKKKSKLECLKDYKSCMVVLIPTIPPFVIQCKDQLRSCLSGASGLLAKAKCFKEFGICLINKGPSPPVMDAGQFVLDALEDGPAPTRHPYLQCKIDLYKCIKAGQKDKLACAKDYKNCMAQLIPTIPPFLLKCRDDLKACLSSASGWRAKARCFGTFATCVKDGISS